MTQHGETYEDFRIAVPTGYENVFSHFYFAQNRTKETITKTLLPSYQTMLIFSFGKKALLKSTNNRQVEVDKCLVLGTIRRAFDYSMPPQSTILVANFKDDAFYRFFGSSAYAKNLRINPDELVDENCFTAWWYELSKMDDVHQQVSYMLHFCTPYLREQDAIAKQLADFKEQSLNPVKAIASNNNQTERNIQIIHKKHFGYSAKEINRYQRFLRAVEYIENMPSKMTKEDWFTIVNYCGYHDQSHLIKDFKHYLSLSPTKYLKIQQDICNPII
ncbi:helix-turn-helix domain-containing protein [Sphingobacterium arenae]|uniref:AraC family transcriptional regulator n=1 Tax=Sphingobacterium arenae TaxID=1280598 RepID=A0ABR7Y6V1_9SPHI|nr:helix-turn-helix domain-containing protein [Sphingobacterium arenae]MBD1427012.1 AraC family transcriptional regulator [Sphingobacterium arenae]